MSDLVLPPAVRGRLRVLLPLWGQGHVRQFFELALPTWLSPRNLPAVARRVPSEFVFLTSAKDRAWIERQPELARLREHMAIDFLLIDDLLVPRNHSTVLTFAWARAVSHFGKQDPDTVFLIMVSDILLSDGAMLSLVEAVEQGYRAVMMAGLQVVYEEVADELRARIARLDGVLTLEPRPLVRWALERPHPTLAASFLDQGISHSIHPNHLFWRIDDDTVVAHYFNIFMFCVRPEHHTFEIRSPLDFAFLPEMCPSGPIKVLDDSDAGFFVECARRAHEGAVLAPGPYVFDEIVRSLAKWMIAVQRRLSASRLTFHAGEPPDPNHPIGRASDDFVMRLMAALPAEPQPHRDHPYWIEQLSAFTLERARLEEGTAAAASPTWRGRIRGLFWGIVGRPPDVHPWHPFWHDYRLAMTWIRAEWLGRERRLLILHDQPKPLTQWLATRCSGADLRRLDEFDPAAPRDPEGALIAVSPAQVPGLAAIIDGVAARLPAGAVIVIHVTAAEIAWQRRIPATMVAHAGAFARPGLRIAACSYASSHAQAVTHRLYGTAARLYTRGGARRVAAGLLLLAPTLVLALIDNLCRGARARVAGHCSAVSVVLKKN